jgi:hypothetical protein
LLEGDLNPNHQACATHCSSKPYLHPQKDNAPQNLGKTITMKREGKNTLLFSILVALSFLQTQSTHVQKQTKT